MAIEVRPPAGGAGQALPVEEVFPKDALRLLELLATTFEPERRAQLQARRTRLEALLAGERFHFDRTSPARRDDTWRVGEIPPDLRLRRVEITGPTDAKMVINALNSGADVFMADFEDANAPTFANLVEGQRNLVQAVRGTLRFEAGDGRRYELGEQTATLIARPRGWHLSERHVLVDGEPIAGALMDAGLYIWHNHEALRAKGSGPYLYLPKLESPGEARLWAEVLRFVEEFLQLDPGTIKVTVLVETFPAAHAMEEILFELRPWIVGMNAGRWDYLFSFIKTYGRLGREFVLPDRNRVTMAVPFMRAYAELLVQTCHRRGAYAIGGMAAFIPSRRDQEANARALARVGEDKRREATQGFDGSWVAHPDLVPVCHEVFDTAVGDAGNQLSIVREDLVVTEEMLANIAFEGAAWTREGLDNDVSVSLQYLASWLRGQGAVGIYQLMEDAATAEIARAQLWQWWTHGIQLDDGTRVTREGIQAAIDQEVARLGGGQALEQAAALLRRISLEEELPDFLTLPGYELLP